MRLAQLAGMGAERHMDGGRRLIRLRWVPRGPSPAASGPDMPSPPRVPPPLPSVARRFLATVLFVDIVDSTARAVELGDSRWLKIAYAHESIVAEHVRQYRGRVLHRLGDGIVAVFRGPAAGIRCAVGLVAATKELGLEIRAGLH